MNAALIGGPHDGLIIPLRRGSSQLFVKCNNWSLYDREGFDGDGSISMIQLSPRYRCTAGKGQEYLYQRVLSRDEVEEAKRRVD